MTEQLAWAAPVRVSPHAVERARERLAWTDDDEGIADRIRGEIRSAILADRVATSRPNWTRGNGEIADANGAYFLWDEDVSHAWVVYRVEGALRVASALEEYGRFRGRAERLQRLRRGLGYS